MLIGDDKLFKTVLGTIKDEGPVIVKVHLCGITNDDNELREELRKYERSLVNIKETFSILRHPNVMPYQGLILNNVISFIRIERGTSY